MSNKLASNNQQNSNDIVINDGSRVYNIKNQRGEILDTFTFTPADVGLVGRYEQAAKMFEELQAQLESKEGSDKDKIVEAERKMKEAVDFMFNTNVSGKFFNTTGPFAILSNGEFYVANIIDAIRAVIEKETGTRLQRAESRVSKYTKKYHK